jgi:hypothetical protein
MKSSITPRLARRKFLRGAGVALALPALGTFAAPGSKPPRRMVAVNFELLFYPPNLIPEQPGSGYELPRYLQALGDLRDDFTFISGTSHPEVAPLQPRPKGSLIHFYADISRSMGSIPSRPFAEMPARFHPQRGTSHDFVQLS